MGARCKHGALKTDHCHDCCPICYEGEDLVSVTENDVEDSKKTWEGIRNLHQPKMDDAYWHRRWAGDALRDAGSVPMNTGTLREAESYRDQIAIQCLRMADAMAKAYKEREEDKKEKREKE